ncbi:MAG: DUF1847 domain-containing protein [Desulfovibrio sp.]|nr:DUF1847 domain-containing protein [Desulfovibrio sp.]
MDKSLFPTCATCPFKRNDRLCVKAGGKHPPNCPTAMQQKLGEEALACYQDEQVLRMARESAIVEYNCYTTLPDGTRIPCHPRILEIMEYAKAMGYKRLGLLFCIGLREDAKTVAEIFAAHGFEVVSVICKVGNVSKAALGLEAEHLHNPAKPETMCNPVLQAKLMNDAEVDLNVLLGLCVAHDTLVMRYLDAPTTVLAVKDRMLGNNPLAALHSSYSNYLKKPV